MELTQELKDQIILKQQLAELRTKARKLLDESNLEALCERTFQIILGWVDSTYHYSDDPSVYRRGEALSNFIRAALKRHPAFAKIASGEVKVDLPSPNVSLLHKNQDLIRFVEQGLGESDFKRFGDTVAELKALIDYTTTWCKPFWLAGALRPHQRSDYKGNKIDVWYVAANRQRERGAEYVSKHFLGLLEAYGIHYKFRLDQSPDYDYASAEYPAYEQSHYLKRWDLHFIIGYDWVVRSYYLRCGNLHLFLK